MHDKLGISAESHALVRPEAGGDTLTLAVRGRLAKGFAFGVDALLECFGGRAKAWASAAQQRLAAAAAAERLGPARVATRADTPTAYGEAR